MLKFDRDVLKALQTLEKSGYETYAVGDCIIRFVSGETPVDWDLVTAADTDRILELLPEGKLIDRANGIVRLDFTREEEDEEGETELVGSMCDSTSMDGTIEEELSTHGFTIAAVADSPERALVDPYHGVDDIRSRMLRTIGDPEELFAQEPIRMMQAMRYVSDLGFDLDKKVHKATLHNWRKLQTSPKGPIRNELELVLTGDHTGKALNMMADSGLMAVVFGEDVSSHMSSGEMTRFVELCEKIDETMPLRLRRLGLLYTTLEEKRGLQAIEYMNYDADTHQHLVWAMKEIVTITFLANAVELKRYIFENGYEKYEYLHNLAKAQRIIYDQPLTKITARNEIMKEIRNMNEPVFLEDLVIDEQDIMDEGITDDPEQAHHLLTLVIAKVHQDPRNNKAEYLLKMAKTYSKNKWKARSRYVKWLR